jgi:DNA-nicking Smr family endonuclease
MSRKGDRPLRDDERELWGAFSKAVKPLKKRSAAKAHPPRPDAVPDPARAEKALPRKKAAVVAAAPVLPAPKSPPPLAALGRREKAKVARGRVEIGGRLDLHGHTQAEAHSALIAFLQRSAARDKRTVLIITGKSGVLRRQVPQWLALPDLRELIVGFESAAIQHGGEGALYVRLRRAR